MRSQKGFTLIELAVVIAIIAILAAVALPRFGDTTAQAELSQIKDLKAQLSSAASIYTAEQATTPNSFTDFVSATTDGLAVRPLTIAVGRFGPRSSTTPCTVGGNVINCNGTFNKWTAVSYTFTNGVVTGTATAGNGNNLGNQTF